MKNRLLLSLMLVFALSCKKNEAKFIVSSPNKHNEISFNLTKKGQPYYTVKHDSKAIIDSSFIRF